MSSVYYFQKCPTCGRRLQIRVEHMGKVVVCYHCHSSLVANENETSPQKDVPEPHIVASAQNEGLVASID